MNILIVPDKFKGSLDATEIASVLKEEIQAHKANIKVKVICMADGGDGSLNALNAQLAAQKIYKTVKDPCFNDLNAHYLLKENCAFIELAIASGIHLIKEKDYNPAWRSSYGTGELINDALEKGAKKIYLFLGGSCTNDGGIGIASAMGFSFINKNKKRVKAVGASLSAIKDIQFPSLPKEIEFYLLCDVKNVFYGKNGAAHVFAAQKGASKRQIELLDAGLNNLAIVLNRLTSINVQNFEGTGAAGGIAGGLKALLNAKIINGFDFLAQELGVEENIKENEFILTAEGKLDASSLNGKVVGSLIDLCLKHNKKIICFVGENQLDQKNPISSIHKIYELTNKAGSRNKAIASPKKYLKELCKEFIKDCL